MLQLRYRLVRGIGAGWSLLINDTVQFYGDAMMMMMCWSKGTMENRCAAWGWRLIMLFPRVIERAADGGKVRMSKAVSTDE